MEKVKCDLCDSTEYIVLFNQTDLLHKTTTESFQMVRCEYCGLCYLNPRPTKNEITKYYSEEYGFHQRQSKLKNICKEMLGLLIKHAYFFKKLILISTLLSIILTILNKLPIIKNKIHLLLIPPIKSYINIGKPKRILDIGCGLGMDTHMYGQKESIVNLRSKGWDVYGIEPSDTARSKLSDLGFKHIFSDLHQAAFKDNYFDVIRLNWSLEHIHNPTKYLEECKKILNSSGKLIIGIPNYNGITYKIFPECVEVPIHLYYFSLETFKKYCQKLEFEILDYYTFSYVPFFLKSLELMGYSNIHQYFIENFHEATKLQEFLNVMSDLELGDDMVFCLTK